MSAAEAMVTPFWALSAAYWLHMLATVLWIGGLAVFSLFVLPTAQKSLDPQAYAGLLSNVEHRLNAIGWFSILVLLASGLIQMSASPHYEGFLSIRSLWSGAILVKHLFFGLMVAVSGYITWGLIPLIRRASLRHLRGKSATDLSALQGLHRRFTLLMRVNLFLGVSVLLLTAVARAV
jgi:uncharacterized membrane protein